MITPIVPESSQKRSTQSAQKPSTTRARNARKRTPQEFDKKLLKIKNKRNSFLRKRGKPIEPSPLPTQMIRRLKELQDLAPRLNCIVARLGTLEIKGFRPDKECPYYAFEFYGTLPQAKHSFGYDYTEDEAALIIAMLQRAGIERPGRTLFKPEFDRRLKKARKILAERGDV